jgi:hypothetical protein
VPEDTRLWKPEMAPHATVMNSTGNRVLSFAPQRSPYPWRYRLPR